MNLISNLMILFYVLISSWHNQKIFINIYMLQLW